MHRKGYTLIELLVVIVLIVLLIAIAMPCYQKISQVSRKAEAVDTIFPLKAGEIAHIASLLDDEVIVVYRYESTIESLREYNELVDQGTAGPLVARVISQLPIAGSPPNLYVLGSDGQSLTLTPNPPTSIHLPCTFEGHEFTKEIDVKMNPKVTYVDQSKALAKSESSTRTDPDATR